VLFFSPEVKQLDYEFDYSPLSSAEVKNAWSYTSTPPNVSSSHGAYLSNEYVFMARYVVKHRRNFTFTAHVMYLQRLKEGLIGRHVTRMGNDVYVRYLTGSRQRYKLVG
jgi:hypothetical protein